MIVDTVDIGFNKLIRELVGQKTSTPCLSNEI